MATPELKLIGEVASGLEPATRAVDSLVKTLDEVAGMVSTIREIAGKTDLLALNASIEAARAGQAGKGFAIVADEVGRLSEKVQGAVGAIEVACTKLRKDSQGLNDKLVGLSRRLEIRAVPPATETANAETPVAKAA